MDSTASSWLERSYSHLPKNQSPTDAREEVRIPVENPPVGGCVRSPLAQLVGALGEAQHDHLPVLERGEAVIEVGGRDRDVLAKPHRVVVVHPGVVARLSAAVLEALEGRARVLVVREAFGAVVAGRSGPVERTLALAPVEADESAVRARAPEHAVLVDVAAAHANALFWNGVELAELGLGIEAQKPRRAGEHVQGVPDR